MTFTPSNPPLGYVLNRTPETTRESLAFRSNDRTITVVKSAIQNYIDSFLNPEGRFRRLMGSVSSPVGLQYVTELTYDEQMKEEPNKRRVHLARFFAENTARLPSILIIDQGLEYINQGINPLVGASFIDGNWQAQLHLYCRVTLSIAIATLSEEDTDTLGMLIVLMFGPAVAAATNRFITAPGQRWEIRLPLNFSAIDQATNIAIEGDVKTQVWTRSHTLVVDFETTIWVEEPTPKIVPPAVPIFGGGAPLPRFLNIQPNQVLPLGSQYPLMIEHLQLHHVLRVSDPNVALVTSEPPYIVQPRKAGSALLLILDRSRVLGLTEDGRENQLVVDLPFRVG